MAPRPSSTTPQPDLFASSKAPGKDAAPRHQPPISRTLLPADLPTALTNLPDAELKRLAGALAAEMNRRNLPQAPEPKHEREAPRQKPAGSSRRVEQVAPVALTQGKLNAIRASIKAGVKPAAIARQFGVSLSAIRDALDR